MDAAGLVAAAALMGLAGTPHCAAMCAAPCAAAQRACGASAAVPWGFHAGRLLGYATGGAVAAGSMAMLRQGLDAVPVLRPLWMLLQLATLALGLWMLASGRMPVFATPRAPSPPRSEWQRIHGPVRSAAIGSAWIAWPCALSQSALLLAALADRPWIGAAAMGAFALASSPGLLLVPLLARRLATPAGASAVLAWPVRLAGMTLAGGSAWALGRGLWASVAAWCAA
jgi:sulfite exporter TauE/SafE